MWRRFERSAAGGLMIDHDTAVRGPVPGDAEAAVARVRLLLKQQRQAARGFAHRLMDDPATAVIGKLCSAIVAQAEGFCEFAWALFEQVPVEMVRRSAAFEWLSAGLEVGQPAAAEAFPDCADRIVDLPPDAALGLISQALAMGLVDGALSLCRAIARHKRAQPAVARQAMAWLRCFDEAEHRASRAGADAPNHLALFDWAEPGTDDHGGHARGTTLIDLAERCAGIAPARWVRLDASTERSRIAAFPGCTFVVGGRLERRSMWRFAAAVECRNVFILSLQVPDLSGLDAHIVKLLKRNAPIGCVDWDSVMRLRQYAIEAFVAAPLHAAADSSDDRCRQRLIAVLRSLAACNGHLHARQAWLDSCQADLLRVESRLATLWAVPLPRAHIDLLLRSIRTLTDEPPRAIVGVGDDESQVQVARLALAVDQQMLDPLRVLLESIVESHAGWLHVYLLTRGLTTDDWQRIASDFDAFRPRMTFTFYDFSAVDYGDGLQILSHTTVSTLDRLLLPELLRRLSRVIYLDTDLLVLSDLSDLWRVELGGARLAAKSSSSPGARLVGQMVDRALQRLPADPALRMRHRLSELAPMDARAFNAGVLVLNLERMRAEQFSERFLPLIGLAAMNDQDVLNVYAAGSRKELDVVWNAVPRQDLTDGARIVHFAGPVKPWGRTYVSRTNDYMAIRGRHRSRLKRAG
jgi:lipopolysaccharide biosynthesis glycosyltransferase